MNIDFSNYKFVVSSGCSYGRLADFTFSPYNFNDELYKLIDEYGQVNWLDIDGDKVISINVSLASQGSDWQSDSLIHTVQKLLDLGIKTENIYCLVEWSQWYRFAVHPPRHYGLDLEKFDFSDHNSDSGVWFEHHMVERDKKYNNLIHPELSFFHKYLDLYRSNEFHNVGKIGDRIYMTSHHMDTGVHKRMGEEYKFFYDHIVKVHGEYPLENKIKSYFDNILRTQYFLEKNGLSYNFLFMQSTLSDWGFRRNNVFSHPLLNGDVVQYNMVGDKTVFNPKFNPINNPESDIEKIMPEIKSKVDQINFDNFWFHESERFRRGGIDEWVLDNMKETAYVMIGPNKLNLDFDAFEILPNHGKHPNFVPYILLWNKVTFNCNFVKVKPEFEKFISEKYWEDYNYDGKSKNMITLSKKEWEIITRINS